MEHTMRNIESALAEQPAEQPAVQNGAASTGKIKLILLWLAVALPLLWGAMKALEDIGSLPL